MSKRNSTKDIFECVLNYLGRECIYCKNKDDLQIHHIMPLSRGGLNSLGNLEVVCRKCHINIHSQIRKIFPLKEIHISTCDCCGKMIERKLKLKSRVCVPCRKSKYYLKNQEKFIDYSRKRYKSLKNKLCPLKTNITLKQRN